MKNLVLMFFIVLGIFACTKNDVTEPIATNIEKQEEVASFRSGEGNGEVTKYVLRVQWDGNGRTKHNCTGFGLCNLEACAFCCFDENDVQVPCSQDNENNNGMPNYNSGIINIDIATNQGFMIYNLNPNNPEHESAIGGELTYYVDQNFIIEDVTILKGAYSYDPTVGPYGGYMVSVIRN